MQKVSFFRHAAVYGLGNLAVYAGGLVLVPLYARCLKPADFGALELLNRCGEVLSLCLLFGAVRQAAILFYKQAADEAERQRVVGTICFAIGMICCLGLLAAAVSAGPVGMWLQIDDPYLFCLACAAILLEGLNLVLLAFSQARLESSFFVLVNCSQLILRVGLSVGFVVGFGWGLGGALLASALTAAILALVLTLQTMRGCRLWPDGALLRELVRFCLPFLPGGLCMFILNNGDRFLLLHYAGAEAVGSYALGYRLATAVTTFSVTPLLMVWGSHMHDVARTPQAPTIFGQMTTRLLGAHLLLGLGVCLFAEEAIALLGSGRYPAAAAVVAPVVLAYWLLAASCLADGGLYVRRRTTWKSGIGLASACVVMVFYLLLVPRYGGLGAAWATVGGFAFQAWLTRVVAQRVFRVQYEDGRLAMMLALAVGLWAASRLLAPGPWLIPGKAVLWTLWPLGLWMLGVVQTEEKEWVRQRLVQMLKRAAALKERCLALSRSRLLNTQAPFHGGNSR